jgi:hypothetical protein
MKLTTTNFTGALLIATGMICTHPCIAQTSSAATILEIAVSPVIDTADNPRFGTQQNVILKRPAGAPPQTGASSAITQVNGQAAQGSFIDTLPSTSTAPQPMDPNTCRPVVSFGTWTLDPVTCRYVPNFETWTFEIRQADGTHAGTITATGAPGTQNFTIVSATGAYYGSVGSVTSGTGRVSRIRPLAVSDTSDSTLWFQLTLYPLALPTVAENLSGPAVAHTAGSAQVGAGQPAHSGELLTVYALNLLPQPQSASQKTAALPVSVTIGGLDATVLWSGRYPGSSNGYQLNIQAPAGLNSGMADLQILSGFVAGPAVQIYVDGNTGQ